MKKQKFRNADEARRYREAEEYQKKMYKQWGIDSSSKLNKSKKDLKVSYTHRSADNRVGSVELSGGVHARKDSKIYTGDLIKGIAVMHKSCLQPVISQEQATESAKMRRG